MVGTVVILIRFYRFSANLALDTTIYKMILKICQAKEVRETDQIAN